MVWHHIDPHQNLGIRGRRKWHWCIEYIGFADKASIARAGLQGIFEVRDGSPIVYEKTYSRSLSTSSSDSLPKGFMRRWLIQKDNEVDLSNIDSQFQGTCRDDSGQVSLR